jgi:UDP-N-acetylmuramate--alanine ligase
VLLPIYPAREKPLTGVTSDLVARAARRSGHRDVVTVDSFDDALDRLSALLRPGDVFLTIGAGNVVELGERWLAGGAA